MAEDQKNSPLCRRKIKARKVVQPIPHRLNDADACAMGLANAVLNFDPAAAAPALAIGPVDKAGGES